MIHSFQIHEVQCRQLYIDRENLKPLKERRSCPNNPFTSNSLGKNKTIEELNDVAYQSYTSNLSSCKNCNRKFTEEKLLIHNRSCTSTNPARRVDESVNRRTSLSDLNQMGYSLDRIDKENRMITSIIPAELQQCPHCSRSFNERAFNKHTRICKNVFVDKRKTFDSRKKRIEGTELAGYYNNRQNKRNTISTTIKTQRISSSSSSSSSITSTFDNKTRQATSSSSSSSSWRQKSQQFRQAMKAARLIKHAQNKSNITGIPLSYLLPPSAPSNINDYKDYIQCDTCGRKFSQMAGERHIPQCRSIRNKPSVLIAGSGHVATTFRTDSMKRNIRRNSFDLDMKQREQHISLVVTKPVSPSYSSRNSSLKSPRTNPINEQILNNKSRTLNDISISMPKVPTRLRR